MSTHAIKGASAQVCKFLLNMLECLSGSIYCAAHMTWVHTFVLCTMIGLQTEYYSKFRVMHKQCIVHGLQSCAFYSHKL